MTLVHRTVKVVVVSRIVWSFIGSITVALWSTASASTNQVQMQAEYRFPALALEAKELPTHSVWEQFETKFQEFTVQNFSDRFHPLLTLQWSANAANLSMAELRAQPVNAARKALTRSFTSSVREVAAEFPIALWFDDRQGFLTDLLLNSVDAVEEEAVAPLDPSFRAIERSWWQRLSASKNMRFGLRPFRTSPYAFMSTAVRDGENLLLMAHVRYHYSNFAEHRFEVALSMPLSPGLALEFGTAYQIGRNTEISSFVLKLTKQIGKHGLVHIGMEAQEHPRFVTGVAMLL